MKGVKENKNFRKKKKYEKKTKTRLFCIHWFTFGCLGVSRHGKVPSAARVK